VGATSYGYFIEGTDLDAAFTALVDDERHRHGSDPYSGTVASSCGVSKVTRQVCTLVEAERLGDDLMHQDYVDDGDTEASAAADARATELIDALGGPDCITLESTGSSRSGYGYSRFGYSRGPERPSETLPRFMQEKNGTAAAIPVGFDEELPTRPHGVPVDLVSLGLTSNFVHQREVRAAIRASVKNARIAGVEVLEDSPVWRTTTRRTEGKVVTEYLVYEAGHRGQLTPVASLPAFGSLAEARKAADELCRDTAPTRYGGQPQPLTLEVLGRTRREDGSALVRAQRLLASRFVVYNVGIITPTTSTPRVRGWWVFGKAGC
jgi:hypothetical protein